MTSLALVIYKTEEIGKTCNLEGFANLIGAIHEYDLRLIAYFLHGIENGTDTATGEKHQIGSVIHDPIDVLSRYSLSISRKVVELAIDSSNPR
jgi:hypothetical protein